MEIELSGHTALVTGASGQLGRVMARTLAECGADVIVHFYRNRESAETVQSDIEATGRRAFLAQADITKHDEVLAMRDRVLADFTAPDILINNAVVQYNWTRVLEQPIEDYEGQFRSSVLHNVLMAQAFVRAMIEKQWGRVIAISTECAMQNVPNQSAYVSGKRGMDGVLRVLAREIGEHNITVNQVAPGWTFSDRDREAESLSEGQRAYAAKVPLRRQGTDQDIANAVAFLASDLASFITGVYLPVCGGNVMPAI